MGRTKYELLGPFYPGFLVLTLVKCRGPRSDTRRFSLLFMLEGVAMPLTSLLLRIRGVGRTSVCRPVASRKERHTHSADKGTGTKAIFAELTRM